MFVAHRQEILTQSLACFRGVLGDANFGELYVGGHRPDGVDHLFMSIQTFNSRSFQDLTSPGHFDFIVVDEFHRAAAESYQELLSYYTPQILLGLTATPERLDGKDVTVYFNNRIAAEIRLPEAIERKLLSPFQYFGITDEVDLSQVTWSRGGYDVNALTNIYALDEVLSIRRAHHIIRNLYKYATDVQDVVGLGFCVSIEHAQFMARMFNENKIPSIALTSESSETERNTAKQRLVKGELRFIFVRDLYNEGVDIPEVNTVLFLRPTESLTVFLQQLGRGLRLSNNKECLTVLDFIGQAHKKYRFEDKFKALLNNTSKNVVNEINNGFPSLPKGCFINLERIAKEYVLDNIKGSLDYQNSFVYRIASFEEDSGLELNLPNFLTYFHLDPRTMYYRGTFSRFCVMADKIEDFSEPIENDMDYGFKQFSFINSRRLIRFILKLLLNLENFDVQQYSVEEQLLFSMFYVSIWKTAPENHAKHEVEFNISKLRNSPVMLAELIELLLYNLGKLDFVDEKVNLGFECPLDLHCHYSRDQLFAGLGYSKTGAVREGVKWLPEKKVDVFLITLNKSEKDYSPTTMYDDYSINEELFHWQSQSTTSEASPTGVRYQQHGQGEHDVLLFVREFKQENRITAPYTFLGTAQYVVHEGSRPMSITYRLHRPIPARYLKKTNKLVVG